MSDRKRKMQLAELVAYICRITRTLSAVFLLLSVVSLLLLYPGEVERGLYIVIFVLNALLFVGSILLARFMQRSEKDYLERTGVARKNEGKGIDSWLEKKDREKEQ